MTSPLADLADRLEAHEARLRALLDDLGATPDQVAALDLDVVAQARQLATDADTDAARAARGGDAIDLEQADDRAQGPPPDLADDVDDDVGVVDGPDPDVGEDGIRRTLPPDPTDTGGTDTPVGAIVDPDTPQGDTGGAPPIDPGVPGAFGSTEPGEVGSDHYVIDRADDDGRDDNH